MGNFEIMRQSLELSGTVGEGLEHIKLKFDAGYYEETWSLFQDVIQAFDSIEKAVEPLLIQLPANRLETVAEALRYALDHIVTAFEDKNWGMASDTMQFQLIPAFFKWKEEMERCFGTYTAS